MPNSAVVSDAATASSTVDETTARGFYCSVSGHRHSGTSQADGTGWSGTTGRVCIGDELPKVAEINEMSAGSGSGGRLSSPYHVRVGPRYREIVIPTARSPRPFVSTAG